MDIHHPNEVDREAFGYLTAALGMAEEPSPWRTASPAVLSERNDLRDQLRGMSLNSLYFLCKGVISYSSIVGKHFISPLHLHMCNDAQDMEVRRRYDLWPRGHFKTSVYSIGKPIWLYLRDHNCRILLAASTATNAAKRLYAIKRVFERNRLFQWLFPECIPQFERTKWSQTEILLPRDEDYQEYSIEAMGVGGRVTGRHYKIMLKDDLIDETALDSMGVPSEEMMNAAKQWHDYSESLLEEPGSDHDHIVGTRWAENDLADHIRRTDPRYRVQTHRALGGCCDSHGAGTPLFPGRFDRETLAAIQSKDPVKYASQYDNNPRHPDATEFRPEWLQYYDLDARGNFELPLRDDKGNKVVDELRLLNKYLLIDPAFSEKRRADYTSMILIGVSPLPPLDKFRVLILDVWKDRALADKVLEQVFTFVERFPDILLVGVESVAAQVLLVQFGEYMSQHRNIWVPWHEFHPSTKKSKAARVRGLRPYFANGQVFMYRGCPVVDEVLSFPLTTDYHTLDAFAQGPELWSVPLGEQELEEALDKIEAQHQGKDPITGY